AKATSKHRCAMLGLPVSSALLSRSQQEISNQTFCPRCGYRIHCCGPLDGVLGYQSIYLVRFLPSNPPVV
ncbi:hypothetical protein NQU36_29885, partial [Escherichia coli]|uniref:hypothetical protein n=1 Tax=Escherichia coli TaxID=562 RepID=UPI0021191BC1